MKSLKTSEDESRVLEERVRVLETAISPPEAPFSRNPYVALGEWSHPQSRRMMKYIRYYFFPSKVKDPSKRPVEIFLSSDNSILAEIARTELAEFGDLPFMLRRTGKKAKIVIVYIKNMGSGSKEMIGNDRCVFFLVFGFWAHTDGPIGRLFALAK